MGMGCQRNVYGGFTTEKTRYAIYRRLGGTRGRSGLVRKNSHTEGFESRTVQPVARRYTNCVFLALLFNGYWR